MAYETIFSTTRLRQATRRSYRPGQTLPVRVYQLVYANSMEARGLLLIAQKIASSLMVEGKLPGGESLATQALGSQGTNPLLDLARSVLQDADGQHREVAGSLEAAFAQMQKAERTQDAYVGGEALLAALTTHLEEPPVEIPRETVEGPVVTTRLPASPPLTALPVQAAAPPPLVQHDVVTPAAEAPEEERDASPLPPMTAPPAFGARLRGAGSRPQHHQTPPTAPGWTLWDALEPEEKALVIPHATPAEARDTATTSASSSEPTPWEKERAEEEVSSLVAGEAEAAKAHLVAPSSLSAPLAASGEEIEGHEVAPFQVPTAAFPPPLAPTPMEEDVEGQLVAALQYLAGVCDGARALDGQGFNKVDAHFGRDLAVQSLRRSLSASQLRAAYKLLVKYQGQLRDAGLALPTAQQFQQWVKEEIEKQAGGPGTLTLEGEYLLVRFPTFDPEKVRQIKALYHRFGGRGYEGATRAWVLKVAAAQAVLSAFPTLEGREEVQAALQEALALVEEAPVLDALLEQVRRCYHLVHGTLPNEQAMRQHIQTPAQAQHWIVELQRRLTDQEPTIRT